MSHPHRDSRYWLGLLLLAGLALSAYFVYRYTQDEVVEANKKWDVRFESVLEQVMVTQYGHHGGVQHRIVAGNVRYFYDKHAELDNVTGVTMPGGATNAADAALKTWQLQAPQAVLSADHTQLQLQQVVLSGEQGQKLHVPALQIELKSGDFIGTGKVFAQHSLGTLEASGLSGNWQSGSVQLHDVVAKIQ